MGCFGRSIICPGRSRCLLRFVFRVVMGPMSYWRYLCLLVYSGVQHILCCVFVFLRLVCPQFIWIVHFWFPTDSSASFLDLYLEFDDSGQLSTKIYDKRDDFNFKIINFQICAAIYQLLLHMVFTSRNWFAMQGPVAIILIPWNVIFIWETGYWTRAIKRFALFDLLKSLYSDTKILSKYIPSLQRR